MSEVPEIPPIIMAEGEVEIAAPEFAEECAILAAEIVPRNRFDWTAEQLTFSEQWGNIWRVTAVSRNVERDTSVVCWESDGTKHIIVDMS